LVYQRSEGEGGGYLLVDNAWFPGWRAEVDGAPAQVWRANIGFRAVYAPPGTREVVLTYAPRSFVVGAVASAIFIVVAALLLLQGRIIAALRNKP
jgi:uncharacterized membrane protein YfhO